MKSSGLPADPTELSAAAAAAALQQGQFSAAELTGAYLRRIDRSNGAINAYLHVDVEGALEQARASDERRAQGRAHHPLDGIPFGIKDNIQVIEAARIANALDFIEKLEHGFQTNIGDRDMRLSGGERQRLTIARAILRNPAILNLDEATSSLDSESEKAVQAALTNAMKNRTVIVIAHRLSTNTHADQIVVLSEGKIVESGTHESLLQQNGAYAKMIELQQFV